MPIFELREVINFPSLSQPNTIVITQKVARKFFGNENPLGKTIRLNGRLAFKVTGIAESPPANSHLQFDYLMSYQRLRKNYLEQGREWKWGNFYTYVTLNPKKTAASVEARFDGFLKKHLTPADYPTVKLHMQSLESIHLTSGLSAEPTPTGNRQALYLLVIIAIFILLIAWINYVNLATARATHRAKEVGIRKVVGAYRTQLIVQFLAEAFFINLLACLFTVLLVDYVTPLFAHFTNKPIQFNLWQNLSFWWMFGSIFFIGVFISGLYPAFVLSSFKPATVLKGKISHSPKGIILRKGLTLFQFAASIILIGSTVAVFQQLSFMRNQDLGINIDKTLILETPKVRDSTTRSKEQVFVRKMQQQTAIKNISISSSIPGMPFPATMTGFRLKGQTGEGTMQAFIFVDDQYIPSYGMKLIAGENFTKRSKAGWKGSVILNESSVKKLGYTPEKIIGKQLQFGQAKNNLMQRIVGVVKDFHQTSLKAATSPVVMFYSPSQFATYFTIKLNTNQMQANIADIKAQYLELFPKSTFDYYFLDTAYNNQYKADERFGEMFSLFSGLAIFVACMGLFGLTSFTLVQRTKELGIRKVLGASGISLMRLLLGDFLKPIALASLVALPVMYWGIQQWLQNFAYRMNLSVWLFILPLLLIGGIALLTVSFQTFKATQNNPVDSLRYE